MKQAAFLVTIFLNFCFCSSPVNAISATDSPSSTLRHFSYAQNELQKMLKGEEPLSYERAIFLIENAWWEGSLDSVLFRKALDSHISNITSMIAGMENPKGYAGELGWMEETAQRKEMYKKALSNWAVFSYLTKATVFTKSNDTGEASFFLHYPYEYARSDPFGRADWTNTQVSNLLDGDRGNCFALASLFNIFSERLESDARLCTTPGHIYIRHADDRGVWYNIELSNGTFPGTGTLATLSYTTRQALQNNISLRELDRKQSIALCLVYLAKGYEQKCGKRGTEFSAQCAAIALRHDPQNLNAMLLRAEGLEERLINEGQTAVIARATKDGQQYEKLIRGMYSLGYREIPGEMNAILLAGYSKDTLNYRPHRNTPQTFVNHGNTGRYASLSWGLFDEMHTAKSQEQFGRTIFDTKTNRLSSFLVESSNSDTNFDPVIFAWNIDPMAHLYPDLSPYAFVANNPIMYIDPDGNVIVDANGKRVVITTNKDGSLKFTPNATADIIRITNALNQTATGRAQLRKVTGSDIKVKMNISQDSKIAQKGTKTTYRSGATVQGNFDKKDNYGRIVNKDGSYGIKESTITIYEGTLKETTDPDSKLEHAGLTIDQAIGAVAGHEIDHGADKKEIAKDLKYEMENAGKTRPDKEKKPEETEKKIIEESKKSSGK